MAPERLAGRTVACPKCGEMVKIPGEPVAPIPSTTAVATSAPPAPIKEAPLPSPAAKKEPSSVVVSPSPKPPDPKPPDPKPQATKPATNPPGAKPVSAVAEKPAPSVSVPTKPPEPAKPKVVEPTRPVEAKPAVQTEPPPEVKSVVETKPPIETKPIVESKPLVESKPGVEPPKALPSPALPSPSIAVPSSVASPTVAPNLPAPVEVKTEPPLAPPSAPLTIVPDEVPLDVSTFAIDFDKGNETHKHGHRLAAGVLLLTGIALMIPTVWPLLQRGGENVAALPLWVYVVWLFGLLDAAYALLVAQVKHRYARLATAGYLTLAAGVWAAVAGIAWLARGEHPLLTFLEVNETVARRATLVLSVASSAIHGMVACYCGMLGERE